MSSTEPIDGDERADGDQVAAAYQKGTRFSWIHMSLPVQTAVQCTFWLQGLLLARAEYAQLLRCDELGEWHEEELPEARALDEFSAA